MVFHRVFMDFCLFFLVIFYFLALLFGTFWGIFLIFSRVLKQIQAS